jgi:ribonuclease VapC
MSRVVLDASAIMVLLKHEPGGDELTPELLSNATCSTVNLAEVLTKLVTAGLPPDEAWGHALTPIRESAPFTDEHAKIAGSLIAETCHLGLSLGDRACLALGLALKAPVYTADRAWKTLKLGIRIHVIR